MKKRAFGYAMMFSLLWVVACAPPLSVYQEEPVVRITADGEKVVGTGADACANDPECNRQGAFCSGFGAGGPTDIVVHKDKVVAVLCYSRSDTTTTQEIPAGGEVGKVSGNNRVVMFAPSTDGKPIEGEVSLEGNNNVLYGNGAGKTVLADDVTVKGNNGRVRGLTIQGSLLLEGNNQGVVNVIVEGDLTLKGNNSVLANVTVFGRLQLFGNNHVLLGVRVGKEETFEGTNYQCEEVFAFQDVNEDKILTSNELGEALSCP
jgi:hypothetical protein